MKVTRFVVNLLMALLLVISLAACGGGDGGTSAPPPSGGGPTLPPASSTTDVTFKVVDTSGRLLEGVYVVRGSGVTLATDANGRVIIRTLASAESVWRLAKHGFADRDLLLPGPSASPFTQSAVMLTRETALTLQDAEAGGTLVGKHGLSLAVPPGALAVGFGGPLIGELSLALTPIDVTQSDIAAAPGGFELSPTGPRESMLNYGMAEVFVVTDLYEGPFILPGRTATIEIPLYAAQHSNGQAVIAGERMRVARLDELSGLWRDAAEGEVVAAARSSTGLALRAMVTSFGRFAALGTTGTREISVTVLPPPGETLPSRSPYRVWGNVNSRGPQAAFDYGGALPSDVGAGGYSYTVRVPRDAVFDVRAEVVVGAATHFGTTQIAATTPDMGSVQLALTRVAQLLPFITYPNGIASVRIGATVPIKVEFAGPQPDRVELYADQTLIGEVSGQRAFYAFLWNTAGLIPSTRRLSAVAHDGTSFSRSSDVPVVLIN